MNSDTEASLTSAPRVAVAVSSYLPLTHVWIHRQVTSASARASLVLCQRREEEGNFPFAPVVVGKPIPQLWTAVRGRLWPVFRHTSPRLSRVCYREFSKGLKEYKIQLVHAHFGTTAAELVSLCDSLRIPLIATFHGFDITSAPARWSAYAKSLHKLFKKCPLVIAVSQEMAQRLVALGCEPSRIRVSYLGVPLDEFPFVDRSGHIGPVRFLHAGRLTAKKGVPDLVRAFAAAFPEPGSAILDIAGSGEEEELTRRTLEEVKPANEVNMLGQVSNQELKEVRARSDVFVLNCRKDSAGTMEGLPISTLEAAAMGLPAIATRHAGIPESIVDGVTGLLVDEYDNEGLKLALRSTKKSETRIRYGRAAREYVENKFDLAKCNRRLAGIYKEAAGIR